jgi:hypothetical protein
VSDEDESVGVYLDRIDHHKRRRDAATLLALMSRVTGEQPRLWGSIVGFGQYHYRYESGREGDAPAAGFSPRKAASTVYLADGVGAYTELLARLGPHTTGVGCIYIKDVEAVDLTVLEDIVSRSYAALSAGIYTKRARDGGLREPNL